MSVRNKVCEVKFGFVRHAMSVDNEAWMLGLPWPGIADSPLCSKGLKMLPGIAAILCEWPPELILSSPLKRCVDTATAIATAMAVRVEVDYGLAEIPHNDGDLPPLPDALAEARPDLVIHHEYAISSSCDFFEANAVRAIRGLTARPEKKICLVGHRGWLMTLSGQDIENGEVICLKAEFYSGDFVKDSAMKITRIPLMW